jgi:hypothetical protein
MVPALIGAKAGEGLHLALRRRPWMISSVSIWEATCKMALRLPSLLHRQTREARPHQAPRQRRALLRRSLTVSAQPWATLRSSQSPYCRSHTSGAEFVRLPSVLFKPEVGNVAI